MSSDFGDPYSNIRLFGGCWDFGPDNFGKQRALAVLAEAVRQCIEHDQREWPEVGDALAYLDRHAGGRARVNAFRHALDIADRCDRQEAAAAALKALAASMARP